MECVYCGASNAPGTRFCIQCGRPLEGAAPKAAPRRAAGAKQPFPLKWALIGAAAVAAIVVLAVVLAVVLGGGGGGWIAYQVREEDGTRSLWIVRPNGKDATPVLEGVDRLHWPVPPRYDTGHERSSPFSPDGNRLLFVAESEGEATLFTYALGAEAPQALAEGLLPQYGLLRFSQDGRRIEWIESDGEHSLHLAGLDGENEVVPVPYADGIDWQVFPDGKRLLVATRREGDTVLTVSDVAGEDVERLAGPVDRAALLISEDGRRIAYAVGDGGEWEVFVARADGSDPVRLAAGLDDVRLHTFSPDGKRLLMSSQSGSGTELALVETDGEGEVTLARRLNWAFAEFTRDGKQVAYMVSAGGIINVYLSDLKGEDETAVLRQADQVRELQLTPDGRWLLVAYEKGDRSRLDAVDLRSRETVSLFQNADRVSDLVMVGSSRVLFAAETGSGWSLYLAPLDGKEAVELAGPVDDLAGYAASPDGKWIVYSEESLGVSKLFRIDTKGKHRERIADDAQYPIWGP